MTALVKFLWSRPVQQEGLLEVKHTKRHKGCWEFNEVSKTDNAIYTCWDDLIRWLKWAKDINTVLKKSGLDVRCTVGKK